MDGAGGASADGISVATRMFGGDSNGAFRAARDGTLVVKGIVFAKIDDKTDVLRTGGESDSGANFNTESFVGLCSWDTRFRGGITAAAPPDINGARRGRGAATVGLRANTCGIGRGANVIFDFLLGFLAIDETT